MALGHAKPDVFVRIAAPPWLVCQPLTEGLAAAPTVSYQAGPPAALAGLLAVGRLECALLPAIDCVRMPRSKAVPGIGVCSHAESRSERLLARVAPHEMRRVAVDRGAGGTVTLGRIILAECFNATPEFVEFDITEGCDAGGVDGIVLTGDAGLAMTNPYPAEYDLGMLWCELTGLPLVQMLWIGRRGAPYKELRRVLAFARQRGLDQLDAIARNASPNEARQYLQHTIDFSMGSLEMEGLRAFLKFAATHGLCEPNPPFAFC